METLWDELFPGERHRIARLMIEQVTVEPDGLTIRLRANGLHALVDEVRAAAGDLEERTAKA